MKVQEGEKEEKMKNISIYFPMTIFFQSLQTLILQTIFLFVPFYNLWICVEISQFNRSSVCKFLWQLFTLSHQPSKGIGALDSEAPAMNSCSLQANSGYLMYIWVSRGLASDTRWRLMLPWGAEWRPRFLWDCCGEIIASPVRVPGTGWFFIGIQNIR